MVFCSLSFYKVKAQLCTGSLGDPVVKLDFGTGTSSHGAALGTGITSYTYSSADFPSDGSYTIEKATNTAGTWWTTTDHTGGGYMMVVNASFSTTDYFYKNTVTGLCPGTTYEFAAWIMNLLVSRDNSPPNITFTIEDTSGTILGTYNTGDIGLSSSATWKQYGFYFTTPSGISTVVIRMRNNKAGAAPGNDIALDDITFRACGPTITSAIQDESTTNLEVCENESKQITLSGSVLSSSYSTIGYQWQTSNDGGVTWTDISGANTANYTFTSGAAGTFRYRLATADASNISSNNCRVFSNEIIIVVKSGAEIPTFSTVQPNCDVPSGQITINSPLGLTYSIDGVNYRSETVFSGLAGGSYNVTAKSGNCVSVARVAVINSVAVSNATPTVSVIQPVICTNPYGTITITSLDAEYSFDNGQNWQSSNVMTGLLPGEYLVKTRNSSLCETTALAVTIETPPGYPPTPTVSVIQPDCLTPTGTISVSDSATAYSIDNGQNWGTSNTFSGLIPGTYEVLIKNTLGCVSLTANEVVLNAYVNNEALPIANASQTFCVQDNKTLNDVVISGTNIKWYDAPISGNLLNGTTILTNRTYYASQTVSICESERIPIVVTVYSTPVPTGNTVQNFCATQNATIGDLEAVGTAIVWYDLDSNGTVLDSSTSLIDGQKYYASQTLNGCESVTRLEVEVMITTPTVVVNDVADSFCDDANDGVELVDLTSYNQAITTDTTVQIRFYPTLADAQSQNNSAEIVEEVTSYSIPTGITTVYARVDSDDKCYQVVKVVLTLFSEPIVLIEDEVSLCENSNVVIDAGSGFDSYLWSTSETTQSIEVSNIGKYSVTVTKNNGTITCTSTKDFEVILSNAAVISSIDVTDWTDNQNTITVNLDASSKGDYEYSVDGYTYQDSNAFNGLLSGTYTVYVRDKKGCGEVTQVVYILNYPKFFTPNGDGYNDTWAVKLSETEPNLKTRIFDRYGKFLKELTSTGTWDGTYAGHQLPSDDYWFVVFREDNKIYKGHFAIKR